MENYTKEDILGDINEMSFRSGSPEELSYWLDQKPYLLDKFPDLRKAKGNFEYCGKILLLVSQEIEKTRGGVD